MYRVDKENGYTVLFLG